MAYDRHQPELGTTAVFRRLARNSAYLAGGTTAAALFMMMAAVLNARALSPREFGVLILFQSATMLVATFMSFSTQQPVIKLGASALAERDLPRLGRIIGLGLLLDFLAAAMAATVAFAFLAIGHEWIGIGPDELASAALFATSLLFSGYLTSNGIFRLFNRFGLLSLIQSACAAAVLAATAALYALDAPLKAYCWTWAIFYALNAQIPLLVGLHLVRRAGVPITLSKGMDRSEISTFLAYCWTTWGTASMEALRSNGDSLLVGGSISVEAAGIYNVAKQLAGVLRKLNSVYASAAFPEISSLSAHGRAEGNAQVRRGMLWAGALVGVVAIIGALLAGEFVLAALFGPHFAAAYVPLAILTAAAAAALISQTLSMYVQVYASPERLFHVYVKAMLIFLLAVFPLTSAFSMSGTAAAQLLFSLALILFCHLALRRVPNAA